MSDGMTQEVILGRGVGCPRGGNEQKKAIVKCVAGCELLKEFYLRIR